MSRLRTRLERLEARQPPERKPWPWEHIDAHPEVRLLYTIASMPARVLDAAHHIARAPQAAAIEALAKRQHPVLAAAADELDEIIKACDRREPVTALPKPHEAINSAHALLSRHRYGRDLPDALPVESLEDAAEALTTYWAFLVWNLGRTGSNFWRDSRSAEGLAWYQARHEADAATPEASA